MQGLLVLALFCCIGSLSSCFITNCPLKVKGRLNKPKFTKETVKMIITLLQLRRPSRNIYLLVVESSKLAVQNIHTVAPKTFGAHISPSYLQTFNQLSPAVYLQLSRPVLYDTKCRLLNSVIIYPFVRSKRHIYIHCLLCDTRAYYSIRG
jgi:hypothetical protein